MPNYLDEALYNRFGNKCVLLHALQLMLVFPCHGVLLWATKQNPKGQTRTKHKLLFVLEKILIYFCDQAGTNTCWNQMKNCSHRKSTKCEENVPVPENTLYVFYIHLCKFYALVKLTCHCNNSYGLSFSLSPIFCTNQFRSGSQVLVCTWLDSPRYNVALVCNCVTLWVTSWFYNNYL